MRKLLRFLKQTWLITLLGIIALCFIIWFIGPLVAFADYVPLSAEINRFIAIGTIILIWLTNRVTTFFRTRKKNSEVMDSMFTENTEPTLSPIEEASRDELQTLKEHMEDALTELKKTKLGGSSGRQLLYQLPWYIIIGPPGSGKTTLLKNSGLQFPLADRFGDEAIRGIGGTRNCDWWFAEDAVLLDTAGRYTTQNSQKEIDSNAWLGFLNLLKKHRSRRPINGAIIAVSISELLESDKSQRQAHASAIRQRIHELNETLGIRFPVYFLFTKCDLLSGFMEYFDDLDQEARSQVWGTTFPLSDDSNGSPINSFQDEFELLEQRLQGQLVNKLESERNADRRNQIYTFPQQFATLKHLLLMFSKEIFQPTRYQQQAMLRGIYFTSATQEGSPIDRMMGSIASNFRVHQQALTGTSGTGKSFFINRLLTRVIFTESGLAGANLTLERKYAWIQRGAILVATLLSILIIVAWLVSYTRNKMYIADVEKESIVMEDMINDLPPAQTNILATLPLLDKARSLPGGYTDQQTTRPWLMTFGLYQGDKLGKTSEVTYKRLLKQVFLPPIMTRLEEQIQDNGANTDYLFEVLKIYLMLENTTHYDANTLRTWISLDWDKNLPIEVTNEQREHLTEHLETLFGTQPLPLPRPLDAGLVDNARKTLSHLPLADRVYSQIKQELTHSQVDDFRISDAAGREAPLVLARKSGQPLNEGLSGLFTYEGYHTLFLPRSKELTQQLAKESWILGRHQINTSSEELTQLNDDVHTRYLDEFVNEWETLLLDIGVAPISSLAQAVDILNILSGDRSPLRLLLQHIEKETTLERVVGKEKTLKDKASEKLSKTKAKLESVFSKASNIALREPSRSKTHQVSEKFERLNELSRSKDGAPAPLDRTLAILNELYIYLNSLLQASGKELVLEQRKQINQVLQKVKLEAKRQPMLISSMLNSIADSSSSLVGGGICEHINATWRNEIVAFCNTAIRGRYPIKHDASREITQEDFGLMFGPGGKMESFFNTYLAASVDKSKPSWHWISHDSSPVCASNASLRQFKRADAIKNAFFRSGGQTPSIGFSLKPMSMSVEITQLNLNIDGQQLAYAHGPIQVTPMKWPGPNNSGRVSLHVSPPMIGNASGITQEGPWALFKLFDHAKLYQFSRSERFALTFNVGGRDASFELRANSAINPFKLRELQQFSCPSNL
jgi:type VI secretion system protein ImpL